MVTATDVITVLQAGPTTRISQQLIVADYDLVQFGPTIDAAFEETRRLQRLEHAVVVEISEPRVPTPTAPRKTKRLAAIDVGRDAFLHQLGVAGADEDEMTFFEAVFLGDVADVDVGPAVTVQVAEVDTHAFVRVVAQHLRLRRRKRTSSFQQLKA